MTLKQIAIYGIVLGVGLVIGYGIGWFDSYGKSATMLQRTVALKWGDGIYGPAYYGAHVYLIPDGGQFSVRAHVFIGHDRGMEHDCGEIGRASSAQEAASRWGRIEWSEDGLHIGDPAVGEYFLPRNQIENHR